ncbi:MAG: hypothetical protein R2710_12590 [Acidimicrobiales bacterium]
MVLGFVPFKAVTASPVGERLRRRRGARPEAELADRIVPPSGTVVTEPARDRLEQRPPSCSTARLNDERVSVRHVGEEPTDLFELSGPVVAEGHFEGDVFVSRQSVDPHSESPSPQPGPHGDPTPADRSPRSTTPTRRTSMQADRAGARP